MSADPEPVRKIPACPYCGKATLEVCGTNVRSSLEGGTQYRCRSCNAMVANPDHRPQLRRAPDKPPRGLARRLWERAEQGEFDD